MSGFNFKLDKVLDLRREEEQKRAALVARARKEADNARQAMNDLEDLRKTGRARLTGAHGSARSVGHLQNLEWVLGRVENELEVAQDAVRSADEEMLVRVRDFQGAVRDRQALDRLKQKKMDCWKAEQAKQEQKTMDEVALTRHGRGMTDASGDES